MRVTKGETGMRGYVPNSLMCIPPSVSIFTTIATNLAMLLANLPLSIRVQTGLHTSMCHVMPFSVRARTRALKKNTFFDVDIVVKNKLNVV